MLKSLRQRTPGGQRLVKVTMAGLRHAFVKQRLRQPVPVFRGCAFQVLRQRIGSLCALCMAAQLPQGLQLFQPGGQQMLSEPLVGTGKRCG